MKDTLIEIENNLQGNSSVDEAENRKDDLEYKEAKEPWLVWLSGLSEAFEPKGCQFGSQSGHMPGFRARSLVGSV